MGIQRDKHNPVLINQRMGWLSARVSPMISWQKTAGMNCLLFMCVLDCDLVDWCHSMSFDVIWCHLVSFGVWYLFALRVDFINIRVCCAACDVDSNSIFILVHRHQNLGLSDVICWPWSYSLLTWLCVNSLATRNSEFLNRDTLHACCHFQQIRHLNHPYQSHDQS